MADPAEELCTTFTKIGLERECEKRGLPTNGGKTEMAKRIVDHDANTVVNDEHQRIDDEEHDVRNEDNLDAQSAERNDDNDEANDVYADDDSNDDGSSKDADGQKDEYDEEQSSSGSDDSRFVTAIGSTPKRTKPSRRANDRLRPYSFRDIEDSIESFGAEEGQDVKVWIYQFEQMSAAAYWNDEQKLIMLRKKLTGTARRFVFTQRDVDSYKKLRKALVKQFAPFVRASDVHRQLAARKKKTDEPIRDYIYEMQRIAFAIDLDESSVCEYIVDGLTDDEYHCSMLYEAHTIKKLKEKLLTFEKVQAKTKKM